MRQCLIHWWALSLSRHWCTRNQQNSSSRSRRKPHLICVDLCWAILVILTGSWPLPSSNARNSQHKHRPTVMQLWLPIAPISCKSCKWTHTNARLEACRRVRVWVCVPNPIFYTNSNTVRRCRGETRPVSCAAITVVSHYCWMSCSFGQHISCKS